MGEPAHRKYITYNEATSDYTLNLDVTGAKGSTPGVDVLFVIDTSGSMGYYYNNLLPTVKSLLTGTNGIVDKIFAKNGNVNSVAMVSFSSMSGTTTTDWYSTSGKETFKEKVNALNASGGTNWTYAMIKAQDLMSQKTNSGSRYTEQSVRLMLKKYTKQAGIKRNITPHMFRHSFATYLIEEGVDISCVQQILGHSSIRTTQIYIHIAAKKQAEILRELHPRNKMKIAGAA